MRVSRCLRRRAVAMTTSHTLFLGLLLLALACGAPKSCDAVSPWKNAEDKLREQGLLHGDTTPLSDDSKPDEKAEEE